MWYAVPKQSRRRLIMSEINRASRNSSLIIEVNESGRVAWYQDLNYDTGIHTVAMNVEGAYSLNYGDEKSYFHQYKDNPTAITELDICEKIKEDISKANTIIIRQPFKRSKIEATLYCNNNGDNRDNTLNEGKDVANQLVDKAIQLAKESGNIVAVSNSPLVLVMDKGQAEQKAKVPLKEIANNIVRTLTVGKVEEMFK